MSDTEDALQPVTLRPIGVIRSPHSHAETTPIQPVYARGVSGRAEILPEYADGLRDLGGLSHIYLIYWLHKAAAPRLARRLAVSEDLGQCAPVDAILAGGLPLAESFHQYASTAKPPLTTSGARWAIGSKTSSGSA